MQLSKTVEFEVEYRCGPQPHLRATPALLLQGREVMFNGAIIDWNKINKRWIVEVGYSPPLHLVHFLLTNTLTLDIQRRSHDWS